jgi:AcrR family transcriptional regulator
MTVFNYFPAKEELVLAPLEEHVDDFAQVVRGRPEGQSLVTAVRAYFLERLAGRDPVTGLSDEPIVLAIQRLIMSHPVLTLHLRGFITRSESALIEVLEDEMDPITARVAAGHIMAVRQVLVLGNYLEIAAGRSADDVYPEAVRAAEQAFDLLEHGIGHL